MLVFLAGTRAFFLTLGISETTAMSKPSLLLLCFILWLSAVSWFHEFVQTITTTLHGTVKSPIATKACALALINPLDYVDRPQRYLLPPSDTENA